MPTEEFAESFGRLAANHLWQSTGFAAVAVLLALVLRANHARVRYWLWMAASVKFLVPFSALAAVGSQLGRWLVPATPVARVPLVIGQIVQPFTPVQSDVLGVTASAPTPGFAHLLPGFLLALWFCGFAVVLIYGWTRWHRVAAVVRASAPLREGREAEALRRIVVGQAGSLRRVGNPPERRLPTGAQLAKLPHINLVSSTARLEPGIFGIFRPVLWLPAGIGDHLGDAELEAILAHELCHTRRRDNLAAAVHMAVEAIFWFHPLVWWLGARLVEERERACDEEVVRLGGEPQIYAESILKVCEFYLASPVACAAGVTGGELKKRIEGIMTNRFTRKLSFATKLLLAAAGLIAVAGPIAIGVLSAPSSRAEIRAATPTAPVSVLATAKASAPAAPVAQLPGDAAAAFAQTTAPLPSFEVASVKPADPKVRDRGIYTYPGGRITCHNCPLVMLIVESFDVPFFQVKGGPRWINDDQFDIEAKPPASSKSSKANPPYPKAPLNEEQRQMLQTLLADRFQLKFHRETKAGPVYLLMKGNKGDKGLKLQDAKDRGAYPWAGGPKGGAPVNGDGLAGINISMPQLAARLSAWLQHPVLDRTGLKGSFDFKVDNSGDPAPDQISGILTSVQEIGLKLKAGRGPVETIVIDHAEKPSAN
ncbi:MAG: M56 family metallopeptidase [Bryobacteraceae bacterium]|jgi:uncharacterized protein (TIGR03435 family)